LPRDIVARLNREIGEVVKGEEMKKKPGRRMASSRRVGSPETLRPDSEERDGALAKVVQQAGIKVD
jgi:hypothetical protein